MAGLAGTGGKIGSEQLTLEIQQPHRSVPPRRSDDGGVEVGRSNRGAFPLTEQGAAGGLEQIIQQYNDTQAEINQAQIALNLEEDPTSERFTVLEQPTIASSPSSPNRFAVLVLALAIAVVLGAAVVATAERSDQAVRNAQDVVAYLEIPPLVGIPYVENRIDQKRRTRRRLLAASVVGLWLGAVFLLVVTPL